MNKGAGLILAAPSSGSGKTTITLGLQRAQNHHRIPYPLTEQPIDRRLMGVEFTVPRLRAFTAGRPISCQRPVHSLRMHAQFGRYVFKVSPFGSFVLYHKIVLSFDHEISPSA